jgi:hypothetical protein
LVYQRDPVPFRLLYLRRLWGLRVSDADAANLDDHPDEHADDESREARWLRSWRLAWQCNELLQISVADGAIPEVPDQEPAEWFGPEGPDGFDLTDYLAWSFSAPLCDSLGTQGPHVGLIAEAAAARGLLAIYIMPFESVWITRRNRILIVSTEVYNSEVLLTDALEAY